MLYEATLYRRLKRQYVQCTACEHFCAVAPGEVGKCGIRLNRDGALYLTVYGEAAALHVDPVEKKPLFHFLPKRPILSLGTLGCNFTCQFCQNWQISQARSREAAGPVDRARALPMELVTDCVRHRVPMIAFTYNEPAVFLEYALDTCKLAHEHGIRTVFVSSGFESRAALELVEPWLDAVNVDLKSYSDRFYRDVCGTRLDPVLRNIAHIARDTRIWIEVTTLLIPGLNDSNDELRALAGWLVDVSPDLPWHISAFHPDYRMLDRPPTPHPTLIRAWEIGRAAGLHYVYTGNVHDSERSTTRCPACGELLIRRAWYDVSVCWRQPGICHNCGAHIPGVWQ